MSFDDKLTRFAWVLWVVAFLQLCCELCFGQGGSYCTMSTWEPRNIATKAGIVASYDPGNLSTLVSNPAGKAPGSGVSAMSNRVTVGTADLLQGTQANQPVLSRADSNGNICKYSEDITQASWAATSATKTGAGELTFTAQNGQVIQNVPTASGLSYTFSFYARTNVPGNTALTILTVGSASGDTTAQTITGTLSPYSVTVLGKAGAGGAVSFGIRDANASGFGSVLFTNMQVRVSTWGSTYVATTAQPIFPGLAGRNVLYFDGAAHFLKTAAFTLNQPEEVYLGVNQWTWTANDRIWDGNSTDLARLSQRLSAPNIGAYDTVNNVYPLTTLAVGLWGLVRTVIAGSDSFLRLNDTETVSGTLSANMGGFTLGATATGLSPGNILVNRVLLCNKTNAPAESGYLAWGIKKQAGVQ